MGKRNKKRAHIKGWHDTPRHSKSKNLNEFAALVEEEVIHVDRIPPTKKRERFQHLSTVSLSSMVGSASPDGSDSEEVGFFLDSEPGPAPALAPAPARKLPADNKYSKQYQKHYKRIIQDDSVYIDKDDDQSSISSSDDLEGLEALSHWAKQDIMTLNQKAVNKEMEDYEMLDQTTFDDIFESSSEEEEEQEEMEDENFLDASMMSQYVPEFMKNSYKGLIRDENKRINKLKYKKPKQVHKDTMKNNQRLKSSVLEKILREFIIKDQVSSYSFTNLTNHGRVNVIPKLAQLFNLELSLIGDNPKNILLKRTKNTSIPPAFKKHRTKQPKKPTTKRRTDNTVYEKQVCGVVGADATPISSSNVGHRMLAAMGWKQGDAIGSNENGIKEPIQVTIRPKNRGLGA